MHFDLTHGDRPPPKRSPGPVLDQVPAERAVRAKTAAAKAAHAQSPTAAAVTTAEDEAILASIIAQMALERDKAASRESKHWGCIEEREDAHSTTLRLVSAARTRSWHTRWRNKLLPLSLRIDFRTVPYAHIPVTVCLRRQGAAGQPAPPPFASCTCARRGRCSGRPARVGYYLDRRCPQQSLSSSWKTPLRSYSPHIRRRRRSRMPDPFHAGARKKKGRC